MKANETVLVVGGCRSGKSSHALQLAERIPGDRRIFIATCVPYDDEMKQRVARHKQERGPSWTALEIPLDVAQAISAHSAEADVILVDCLTLWISNVLTETRNQTAIDEYCRQLTQALRETRCPVILVSNEVGTGIVPANPLARLFRDSAGFMNQRMAACTDRVIWMVAGIPVVIKSNPAEGGKLQSDLR